MSLIEKLSDGIDRLSNTVVNTGGYVMHKSEVIFGPESPIYTKGIFGATASQINNLFPETSSRENLYDELARELSVTDLQPINLFLLMKKRSSLYKYQTVVKLPHYDEELPETRIVAFVD